jgi:hypothetical protein
MPTTIDASNSIFDTFIWQSAKEYGDTFEDLVCKTLGVTRAMFIRHLLERRVTCLVERTGHEVYSLDGKPFLRVGPITVTWAPRDSIIAYRVERTMEPILKPKDDP